MPPAILPTPTTERQLLEYLLEAMRPMSRTRVKELLGRGLITVNGSAVTQFDHPLCPGDRVAVEHRPNRARPDIDILFQDDSLIVVDKPPGLLTVATDTEKEDTAFVRLNALLAQKKAGRAFVVHRLDRETSGLLLFARSAAIREKLQSNWDEVVKTYLAVVEGAPRQEVGAINSYLVEGRDLRVRECNAEKKGAKRAVTRFRVIDRNERCSLLEVILETGRKHQIRVHLAGLGCPIVGDRVYGAATDPAMRLGLHAWRLTFDHPVTGVRIEVESALDQTLRRLVKQSPRG